MSYGDSRRSELARQFGSLQVTGFGLSAALGIGAAVIVDLVQQREASALYVINRWIIEVTSLLGVQALPLYAVMLILMAIGAGTVIFFQPLSLRSAFMQGFGALAVLVTLAPSDLGAPLNGPAENAGQNEPMDFERMFEETSMSSGAQLVPVSLQQEAGGTFQLRIQITFPEGLNTDFQQMVRMNRLVGKLYDAENGVKYNIFRSSGAEMSFQDGTLRIVTQIDALSAPEAELWLLVEANGYRIQEESFRARTGPNPIWNIDMQPSSTPLLVQRLRHSYRF